MIQKLLLASHNQGKIAELSAMLAPYGVEVLSAKDMDLPDVEETGETFAENAALKAEALAEFSGLPCLADDSGLCVDALGGRPGVFSARYAADNDARINKLIDELRMQENPDWSAHFSCVLALKEPNKKMRFFEGRVDGKIIAERRGNMGFGFDPIFVPNGYKTTFAEMSKENKAAISHRGKALQKFIKEVFGAE
ncbi:MAG: RdgB/HAM1 family non-canonical purine NTP pyrophosphatase [Alphaproteobacteria bacterium]|nr:RdgB/HAM1 family non-canonical purine NTP pyrophosphatase [Alphaproteobacteria bacterium]